MSSLNTLHTISTVGLCLIFVSFAFSVGLILTDGRLSSRRAAAFKAEMDAAGVDTDDDAAVDAFAETSPAFERMSRSTNTVGRLFVAGLVAAFLFALVGGTGSVVYTKAYQGEVRIALAEAYGVSVDHRSLADLPQGNQAVSDGLVLRLGDRNAQCTVATGASPVDLTVICGGQELRPRR